MFTNLSGLQGALIGLALVVFFIVRQFSIRRVISPLTIVLPLALTYFGLQGLGAVDEAGWVFLGVNLSLGVALGFARGATVHIWVDEHRQALMRGTPLTLMLWLVTLAVKIALLIAEGQLGLGALTTSVPEIMLPAAATLVAQLLVVYLRSRDLRVPIPA